VHISIRVFRCVAAAMAALSIPTSEPSLFTEEFLTADLGHRC